MELMNGNLRKTKREIMADPELGKMLYFENATATFSSFTAEPEVIKF